MPGEGVTVRYVEAVMKERPRRSELIVAGDFNVDMEGTDGWGQDENISALIKTAGIEYLAGNFLPRRRLWCKDWRMWTMVRQGTVVRSWMDYTLGS